MDHQDRIKEQLDAEMHTMRHTISEIVALNKRLQQEIEDLRQDKAALLDKQEHTDLALWASQDFLWDWNVATNMLYVNDGWSNILAYEWKEERRSLQEWKDLFHEEDIDGVIEAAQAYVEGPDKHYEAQCRIKNGLGEWIWVRLAGKMIFKDSQGRTMRALGLGSRIGDMNLGAKGSAVKPSGAGLAGLAEMVIYEDPHHSIVWCSQLGEDRKDIPSRHFLGEKCYKVWFGREEPCPQCLAVRSQENGTLASREIDTQDGRIFDQQAYPVTDQQGQHLGSLVIIKDITEQCFKNQALEESEQRYRALFENNPIGLFRYDASGQITDLNHYMLQVLGASSKDELLHLDQLAASEKEMSLIKYELLETVRDAKSGSGEIHFTSSWGREVWLQYKANPVYDQSGKVTEVIVACEEISERKQAEERIRYLSFNDPLTGLYNRAFFQEELKRLDTQRQLPMSIIMGDLNSLKLINDAFGHHKGDAVLKAAADVLRTSCRREDIIARLGGDEFVVLLPMTNAEVAEEICNRIKNNCKKTEETADQVSLALGMATRTDIAQDIEDVMREAEDRMYRNKLIESRNIRSSFILSLERTLREKSHETEEHTARLQQMSSMIGKGMRMSETELDSLNLLAALHDIGKIAIPSTILDKADLLSAEEWDTMKKHPEIGYRIALSTPELVPIAEAILAHHECWNGNGYPLGLREEKIPLLSRILAVCDAYDVMVNGRPYREAISKPEALQELQRCAGTQFDPSVVKVFIERMA